MIDIDSPPPASIRPPGALAALGADLAALGERGRLRTLSPRAGCDFSSNDYLALSHSPALSAAITEAIARGVAVGSGGSRLLRGNDTEREALEAQAATHFGSEAAMFFAAGCAANVALLATLPQRDDVIVHDSLVHASARDGLRLGRAPAISAGHNDPNEIERTIVRWRAGGALGTPWIVVERLYSMDGDQAPLADLMAIADRYDAMLLIDEAHATGVFGHKGRGLAAVGLRGDLSVGWTRRRPIAGALVSF